jgi:hypothetical protein
MNYDYVFIESFRDGYPISLFTDSELDFIISKELIDIKGRKFFPKFVGELITTENSYFSLPKNFAPTDQNINLFKKVLLRFKELKGEDGKTLLTNNSFSVLDNGDIKSEKFYFNELKEFFLDYITYEFIYPNKQIKKHSTSPISGGKIDIFSTIKNRTQKGPGITYKIKDITNEKDWNIDDIYWSTINQLSKIYGSEDDISQILDMKELLEDKGYILRDIDLTNKDQIIDDIKKCEVGIIHQPIKNTLIDYFKLNAIGKKFKINAFYTSKFQYVWEELVKESLKHNDQLKNEVKEMFSGQGPTKRSYEEGDRPIYYRELIPDLFSYYDNKKFIGDAKYYNDPNNSNFDKEMYVYNKLIDNKYPMCVFIPSIKTKRIEVREHGDFELIVFFISVEEAINDAINNSNRTISKIQTLISKNTKREF